LSPVQVSILIPVYNEEDLVSAAIECVLTLPLWASVPVELIAVDDGSTGGSGEALDRIARERPCRVFARRPTASGQTV
jgi:glycosyltransferase involved in cell wall biosynthesis